ncbi:hypothetical protein E2C01_030256 [Portunus trituberculatus]|uniref:Uncharacterized protein n=1 Tax=Portunus trituberculatus TaxID=210409 RepID=A0A5B7EU93_PORTR|nr:hypothetical protein [Portunus trituberculatus]
MEFLDLVPQRSKGTPSMQNVYDVNFCPNLTSAPCFRKRFTTSTSGSSLDARYSPSAGLMGELSSPTITMFGFAPLSSKSLIISSLLGMPSLQAMCNGEPIMGELASRFAPGGGEN